jgi:proliferating cell nuclear antigen
MYLQTIQASALKTIFEVLKDIVKDVNVYFSPAGMRIQTFDIAKVTLVHMFLPAENFERYECEEEMIAGLNMDNTYKLLKSITNNDSLTLRMDGREVLDIEIENTTKHTSTTFHLKLLDINEDDLHIPDIEFDVVTTMPSVDFQRITRDMANLSSEITIIRTSDAIELQCVGDFADQKTSIECVHQDIEDPVDGTYALKYINTYTKATNLCSSVQIFQFRHIEERPIVFRYAIANLGEIRFYLAQRITDA